MPKLKPVLRETPSGLLIYDLGADYLLLFPLAQMLQDHFGLEAGRLPAFGLDTILVELLWDKDPIIVGWDIWSDLTIMAGELSGNEKIREIATYLDGILEELEILEEKLIKEQEEKKEKENNENE